MGGGSETQLRVGEKKVALRWLRMMVLRIYADSTSLDIMAGADPEHGKRGAR